MYRPGSVFGPFCLDEQIPDSGFDKSLCRTQEEEEEEENSKTVNCTFFPHFLLAGGLGEEAEYFSCHEFLFELLGHAAYFKVETMFPLRAEPWMIIL